MAKNEREVPVFGEVAAFGCILDGEPAIDLVKYSFLLVTPRSGQLTPVYTPMILATDGLCRIPAPDQPGFLGVEFEPKNRTERQEIIERLVDKVISEGIELPKHEEEEDEDEDEEEDEDEDEDEDDEDKAADPDEPVRVRPSRR